MVLDKTALVHMPMGVLGAIVAVGVLVLHMLMLVGGVRMRMAHLTVAVFVGMSLGVAVRLGHFVVTLSFVVLARWQGTNRVAATMPGHSRASVFGVEDRIDHQLAHVIVFQPVNHLRAVTAGPHQAGHPQFGQMLRHRRRGLAVIRGRSAGRKATHAAALGNCPYASRRTHRLLNALRDRSLYAQPGRSSAPAELNSRRFNPLPRLIEDIVSSKNLVAHAAGPRHRNNLLLRGFVSLSAAEGFSLARGGHSWPGLRVRM